MTTFTAKDTPVAVGDRAPTFTAPTQSGEPFVLADHIGRQVIVLYFYPQDGTPVCSAEACAFRDAFADFFAAGAKVVGVSGDSVDSHRAFAGRQRLPFTLVSDSDGAIRRAFGVPSTLWLFPGRVTYVIDRQGMVRHVFNSALSAGRHVTEALAVVRSLAG
jgi:peroxiredoxin Q/BCP